jgi:hypothetical protein
MHHLSHTRVGVLLLACAGASAWAQDTPPIAVTAAYTQVREETYFESTSTNQQIGQAELGLLFHTIQGMQMLQLDARLVNYDYQVGNGQDHTEINYTAGWQWAVTPRVHGNLSASQHETPKPDTIDGQLNVPNRQTQTHYRADVEYEIMGPLHVVAGVNQDKHTSQYFTASNADSRSDSRDLGLRYDFSTGSWIKASLKSGDGRYLAANNNPSYPNDLSVIEDGYQQQEQDLRLHWSLSAANTLDLYLTNLERTHERQTTLDFSGQNYGASASWAVSARGTLVLAYAHALSVVLAPVPLLTEQDSLSWGWNWQTSSRTQVRVGQTLQQLDYRNPLSGGYGEHKDSSHDSNLSLVWTPGTQWQISAALAHQAHGSNLANQDYSTKRVSFTAQFSY